jgi:hypothetical protein
LAASETVGGETAHRKKWPIFENETKGMQNQKGKGKSIERRSSLSGKGTIIETPTNKSRIETDNNIWL